MCASLKLTNMTAATVHRCLACVHTHARDLSALGLFERKLICLQYLKNVFVLLAVLVSCIYLHSAVLMPQCHCLTA